ncbi:MAG: S-layer homology domain-containing protein [Peptoniphilus sp.]|nr:S-layer homology domain-containing protein [Peptoniphilus sp.]MDY6044743.1 S-layer homology domain-containing protein [Peptoniphilus sp.]
MERHRNGKMGLLLTFMMLFTLCLQTVPVHAEGDLISEEPVNKAEKVMTVPDKADEARPEKIEDIKEETKVLPEKEKEIQELEVSDPSVAKPVGNENTIQISSFEDLKPYLEYKDVQNGIKKFKRFALKAGNYEITQSFEVDLNDKFFDGKENAIKYGLISADQEFTFNGNGNTISFKQDNAVALFGTINAPAFTIENLKINYPKNVAGFGFAHRLQSADVDTGLAKANGIVKDISVHAGGNVTPLPAIGMETSSNNFAGNFKGILSSGFSFYIGSTNLENIEIDVDGNIGSNDRPEDQTDMVGAFGFAFHYDNVRYEPTFNGTTWEELHDKGNPEVLKDAGHILGLTLNVGGNIQAYGYDRGYCAGLGNDMAEAWMENADVTVAGDIILDLSGNNTPKPSNIAYQYVYGLSDELMNLTDSSFSVNNIVLNTTNIGDEPFHIGAWARNNSKGNYINLKNNTVTVKGKLEGITDQHLLAAIGFENDWNSFGTNGTDWLQENENNTFNIGEVNLQSDKNLVFTGLAEKWRTGKREKSYTLPSASLKKNTLNCGDVTFKGKNGVTASLMMYNSSNAKDNTLNYGNVSAEGGEIFLYGMGNLRNDQPKENFYENIVENNKITLKDLTVNSEKASWVALMAGTQDEDQVLKNCTVKAGKVDITLNSSDTDRLSNYVGGIADRSDGEIDSARVFVDSVNVVNKGAKRLYFGLGPAAKYDSGIKNSGVFVDSNVNVTTEQEDPALFGGGFVGYAKNATIENNHFQIDGKNNIEGGNATYGGFAGWIRNSKLKNNSSLFLNGYMPCIGYADQASSVDSQAHYINEKPLKYFSGLLASSDGTLTISNSTFLVPKEAEDSILYRKDNVSKGSTDNYLVVVDNGDDFNRKAYKVAETTSTVDEMGKEIPVLKKVGESIGAINIMGRSFQDKYWNTGVTPYEITEDGPEKNFVYMTGNKDAGTISVFGIDKNEIISNDGTEGHLADYYHRHAGLISDSGIIYDLLGIKGSMRFNVLYDGNGADGGSVPKDINSYKSGESVTVLSHGNLSKTGYEFIEWNTKADGSGIAYKVGDAFDITENTTLYAQWKENSDKPNKPNPDKPHNNDHSTIGPFRPNTQLNKEDHYQYMIGYEDMTFGPEKNMTREEVAVMFSRLLVDRPVKGRVYDYNFSDIDRDRWSVTAISYMNELGMIKGYPDGTFKPTNSITRAEFAAIATRFADLTEGNKTFSDVDKEHWSYDAINRAATAGWIHGYPDGSFKPDNEIKRVEVISITNNMLDRFADENFVDKNRNKMILFNDVDKTYWGYYLIGEATNGHEFVRDKNGKSEIWKDVNGKSFVYEK